MNCVVTGARGNVGAALVERLLSGNSNVSGIDYGPGKEPVQEQDRYWYYDADLIDAADNERVVSSVVDRMETVHAWINVVGGFAMGPTIEDSSETDWQNMINLNFHTSLKCCRNVLPHMKSNGFGRIINFGSVAGEDGMANAGPYVIGKAAVMALSKTIALEGTEHGITCNAIVPTIIDTPQNREAMPDADFNTWTKPESIADTIVELLESDRNGEMVHV